MSNRDSKKLIPIPWPSGRDPSKTLGEHLRDVAEPMKATMKRPRRKNLVEVLREMPHGLYEANRYDTDDLNVLHLWKDGVSWDLNLPKGLPTPPEEPDRPGERDVPTEQEFMELLTAWNRGHADSATVRLAFRKAVSGERERVLEEAATRVKGFMGSVNSAVVDAFDVIRDLSHATVEADVERRRDSFLSAFLRRQREWSKKTFGSEKRTRGITKHISKELIEIVSDPTDLVEWVDVILLAMDGFWRHGGQPEQLGAMMEEKFQINVSRIWPKTHEDEAPERDRSIAAETTHPNRS